MNVRYTSFFADWLKKTTELPGQLASWLHGRAPFKKFSPDTLWHRSELHVGCVCERKCAGACVQCYMHVFVCHCSWTLRACTSEFQPICLYLLVVKKNLHLHVWHVHVCVVVCVCGYIYMSICGCAKLHLQKARGPFAEKDDLSLFSCRRTLIHGGAQRLWPDSI